MSLSCQTYCTVACAVHVLVYPTSCNLTYTVSWLNRPNGNVITDRTTGEDGSRRLWKVWRWHIKPIQHIMGRHALDRIAVLATTHMHDCLFKVWITQKLVFFLCFHYYDSGCLSPGRQLAVKTALCLSWKVSRVGEFSLSRGNHGKIGQREQRLTQRISKHIVKMGVVKGRQVLTVVMSYAWLCF